MHPYNTAPEKKWTPIQIIPISLAVLCADCDAITEAGNDHCLACGSHAIMNLEKLLNRQMAQSPDGEMAQMGAKR